MTVWSDPTVMVGQIVHSVMVMMKLAPRPVLSIIVALRGSEDVVCSSKVIASENCYLIITNSDPHCHRGVCKHDNFDLCYSDTIENLGIEIILSRQTIQPHATSNRRVLVGPLYPTFANPASAEPNRLWYDTTKQVTTTSRRKG